MANPTFASAAPALVNASSRCSPAPLSTVPSAVRSPLSVTRPSFESAPLSMALREAGIDVVLSGGAVVAFYSDNR